MEEVCPACNGLTDLSTTCPFCGARMSDGGALGNYFGPYSPYADEDTLNLLNLWSPRELTASSGESTETIPCVHLMVCPHCGWDTRVPIVQIKK